jgi:hypothetical protein
MIRHAGLGPPQPVVALAHPMQLSASVRPELAAQELFAASKSARIRYALHIPSSLRNQNSARFTMNSTPCFAGCILTSENRSEIAASATCCPS